MAESEFARRLRARIESDPSLTVAGLAISAGLDNSTLRGLLSGKATTPRLSTMEKVCAALGTTVDEFMAPERTDEEREILRLVSLLSEPLRRQLLGYAQALADEEGPLRPATPAKGE